MQSLVAEIADALPASQRRVADLVVDDPESVAFGTLGSVAERADTSTPTVIRFAAQLGFDGFTALRDTVRDEVSHQLRSAVGRVRQPRGGPLIDQSLAVERTNVERTFAALDDRTLDRAAELLADVDRRIWVLPSTQVAGVGSLLADNLGICRPRVVLLEGTEFRVQTVLTGLDAGDVVVSLDVQRHEGWLVRVQRSAVARGAVPVAVTDRLPCSLDLSGGLALTFSCDTTSPFDSQVGLVAIGNLLVSAVVERLRSSVAERVDALERTWVRSHLFEA